MSRNSSWKERFARRVPLQALDRVPSGSPVRYRLKAGDAPLRTVVAALALARRHVPMYEAKAAMDRLAAGQDAVTDVPAVEDAAALEAELLACGVSAVRLAATGAGLPHKLRA